MVNAMLMDMINGRLPVRTHHCAESRSIAQTISGDDG